MAVADRWRLAHQLGPVLVAAFAASPLRAGAATGWCSTRQRIWGVVEPGRTRSALGLAADPVEAWARYIMAARVMLLTGPDGACLPVRHSSTFGDWVGGRGPVARHPTEADLAYHATTLFPPVRPRGWLEIRYLDALPAALWQVPVAVVAALLDDPGAADAALDVTAPVTSHWARAARLGPAIRTCATPAWNACGWRVRHCPGSARTGRPWQPSRTSPSDLEAARCPADDLLDIAAADGPAGLLAPDALSPDIGYPADPHPDRRPRVRGFTAGAAAGTDAQEAAW